MLEYLNKICARDYPKSINQCNYSKTSLQRTCFIADTSLQRTPFPGPNYLKLSIKLSKILTVKILYFEPLYSGHLSIEDTICENQLCPLLRDLTVFTQIYENHTPYQIGTLICLTCVKYQSRYFFSQQIFPIYRFYRFFHLPRSAQRRLVRLKTSLILHAD